MNPITINAKVMQNFTICIAQPIRDHLELKKGDEVILSMDENGEIKLMKGVSSLGDLVGIGKKSLKALGGGEAFLKKERKQWDL
ncbi:MAG: hypothetical protein A2984_02510 [Omnitrophica WOR_2 bacterium RIFCSPLOWO2_01_FULL_41_12]|nr:MAG: hypothetical protein A2984_02510 [Omnitrophica WOR_2 bacterium RIFCSPLOWO2_01_FULL_41_12]